MDNLAHLEAICIRLGFFPSRPYLNQIPSWQTLVEKIDRTAGLETSLEQLSLQGILQQSSVHIPSIEQARVAALLARDHKKVELSRPGTRKTISALLGLEAIQHTHGEEARSTIYNVLISCPSYVIPIWMREIERVYNDPRIVVVTRRNRINALQQAAQPYSKFVIVSHTMTYRNSLDAQDPDAFFRESRRFRGNREKLLEEILQVTGREPRERMKNLPYMELFKKYLRIKDHSESRKIIEALRMDAFNPEKYQQKLSRYVIIDEFHNIVNPQSETGMMLEGIFRDAEFGLLLSGTGLANEFNNLRYASYLLGLVDDPRDFGTIVRNDPGRVKALLDMRAVRPTLTLKDIDPHVPDPVVHPIPYEPSPEQFSAYLAILNSQTFDAQQRYLLLSSILSHPQAILPQNISGNSGIDSLATRMQTILNDNPELLQSLRTLRPTKLDIVKDIVTKAKSEGRKCLIACEYTSDITSIIERELSTLGCVRVDQSVSPEQEETPLTPSEVQLLQRTQGANSGHLLDEKTQYRSHLSPDARKVLNIKNYEIFGLSDREKVVLDFTTNPDIAACAAGYKSLREGIDCQEATVIILYDITTVPAWFSQFQGRAYRSGQRSVVDVYIPFAPNTIEEGRFARLNAKLQRNHHAEFEADLSWEDLRSWQRGESPEQCPEIAPLLSMNSRSWLSMLFASLNGKGSSAFVDALTTYNNAFFFARMYNYDWETSYSANVGRCIGQLISTISDREPRSFDQVLDAGGGPNVVARTLRRPTINVDIVKYQHHHGIDACERDGIQGCTNYLGSITDLKRLISIPGIGHEALPGVYDPRKTYEGEKSLPDKSLDLIVCSMVLDLLSEPERASFFAESRRTLSEGGYLILAEPTSCFDCDCRNQFYADMHSAGFEVDLALTGTYGARTNQIAGGGNPGTFEIHLVTARKHELPGIDTGLFCMTTEYIIKDPAKTPENSDAPERPRLICQDFYNKDNGRSLADRPPFTPYVAPTTASLLQDAPAAPATDFERQVREDLEGCGADKVQSVLDKILDSWGQL